MCVSLAPWGVMTGSRPARSDDRRALGRRHPAGAASPHTEASWANALGQCFRGDYLICYSPQEGGVVWEAKGGFWLPTFVMGRNRPAALMVESV